MKLNVFITLGILIFLVHCDPADQTAMTVSGRISVEDLGITLVHEHLLVDFIGADSTGSHRWDRQQVIDKVLPYLQQLEQYNVRTLVDCTPQYLGRDPQLLKQLSRQSGIHIITTTGLYGAYDNKFIPTDLLDASAEELEDKWTTEWRTGIKETGVYPGIIKIGVDRGQHLSAMHEKLVRAACRTHLLSGLPIVSHTGPEIAVYDQLDILEQEGVAPDAFVWTHAQNGSDSAHVDVARRGAWVSLDHVTADSANMARYIRTLVNLKENNLLHRVLISHDAGWYHPGEPNGGSFRPFTAIFTHLIPALKQRGFTQADIDQLLIQNPKEILAINIRHPLN